MFTSALSTCHVLAYHLQPCNFQILGAVTIFSFSIALALRLVIFSRNIGHLINLPFAVVPTLHSFLYLRIYFGRSKISMDNRRLALFFLDQSGGTVCRTAVSFLKASLAMCSLLSIVYHHTAYRVSLTVLKSTNCLHHPVRRPVD